MATQLQTFPYTKAQKCVLKLHIFTAIHTNFTISVHCVLIPLKILYLGAHLHFPLDNTVAEVASK